MYIKALTHSTVNAWGPPSFPKGYLTVDRSCGAFEGTEWGAQPAVAGLGAPNPAQRRPSLDAGSR